MENFIYDYFIEPIWSRTGYNTVNTLVYAVIALAAVYALFIIFRRCKIEIDRGFVLSTIPFILLGSTMRVVTDSIDTGVFQPITPLHSFILSSHLFDYGYLTVTPGIYIVTAAIFLISVFTLHSLNRIRDLWKVGIILWLPFFLLLLPFMKYALFAIPVLLLAIIPWLIARKFIKDDILSGIVFAHSLDGAATFFAIDIFSGMSGIQYSEQHVFSNAIGEIGGSFLLFYLIKILISFGAAYIIDKEKMPEDEKYYIALVLIIMGLAPGVRDVLRMMVGG